MKHKLVVGVLAMSCAALVSLAQDSTGQQPRRPQGGQGGGPRGGPLMAALDTNHDGELDATEIANATAALKKMDKNGDGKLSADELRPARPGGGQGQGGGGNGQGRPRRSESSKQ